MKRLETASSMETLAALSACPADGGEPSFDRMPEPVPAPPTQTEIPAGLSKTQVIVIKIVALTAISLALIFAQGWAAPRYYQPDYVAGFYTGLLEGALMPAALPGLLGGKDLPIYAPNNEGRAYKIGYIVGRQFLRHHVFWA